MMGNREWKKLTNLFAQNSQNTERGRRKISRFRSQQQQIWHGWVASRQKWLDQEK
jgi:hypothetical protein